MQGITDEFLLKLLAQPHRPLGSGFLPAARDKEDGGKATQVRRSPLHSEIVGTGFLACYEIRRRAGTGGNAGAALVANGR